MHLLTHVRSFVLIYGDMITLMVISSCVAIIVIELFRRHARRSH